MKQSRQLPVLLLAVGLCIGLATGIFAATRSQTVQALLDPDIQILYNGEVQILTNAGGVPVYPLIYQGSTYLPVRALAGIFGEDVNWDAALRRVILGTLPSDESQEERMAQEVFRLVNEQRAAQGLSALAVRMDLQEAAQIRALEIARSFSHTRPDGASCFTALDEAGIAYQGAGENIASGQVSPSEVMEAWMQSQGHKKNIVNSAFTHLGVGCYRDETGRLHWVQLFIGVKK